MIEGQKTKELALLTPMKSPNPLPLEHRKQADTSSKRKRKLLLQEEGDRFLMWSSKLEDGPSRAILKGKGAM